MVVCEFSGEQVDKTIKVEIAGAVMNVAPKYSHLGNVIEEKNNSQHKASSHNSSHFLKKTITKRRVKEPELEVVENVSSILQSFMAKKNLTTKHLAHNASLKEGMLQKMIQGKIHFDIKTAQILEKTFDLQLTQERDEQSVEDASSYLIDNTSDSTKNESSSSMEDLMREVLPYLKK
ncbi:MAG: hypothetical protein ACLFPL_00295 [Candidatus Nanoarchaeia archaeon]